MSSQTQSLAGSRRVTVRHGLAEGTGSKGGGTARADWLGSSHRRARGLVSSQNGVWARAATASQKKAKKNDDDEIRTHAILEGFTPVAEKMDCYVSHFLTGIISREKLAAEERSPVSEKR